MRWRFCLSVVDRPGSARCLNRPVPKVPVSRRERRRRRRHGQVTYEGQGDYAGLTMYLLTAGSNEVLTFAGWIEEAE